MKKTYTLLAFVLLIFTACNVTKVAVLKPDVPPQYLAADGFTTQKADSLSVTFGFLYSTPSHLVFDVEVINRTGKPVKINPQNFYYQAQDAFDSTQWHAPMRALSELRLMADVDAHIKNAKRAMTTRTILTVVGVVASVALEVALTHNVSRNDRSNTNFAIHEAFYVAREITTYDYFNALAKHVDDADYLERTRTNLGKSLFREIETSDSTAHFGTVYFPRNDAAKTFRFNFKIDSLDFPTNFKQRIITNY